MKIRCRRAVPIPVPPTQRKAHPTTAPQSATAPLQPRTAPTRRRTVHPPALTCRVHPVPTRSPVPHADGPAEEAPAADEPLPAPPLYPNAQFPDAQSANGPYGYPQSQPQNFFNWVRGHGIQRGPDRWIGGVASGIAHRLGVDPLIVRGVFIVLSIFAGIGVLLYGVAWALLPEPDGRIHVQEAGAGRWSTGMTGALITTVIGFPSLGGGFWGWERNGFGGFLWTAFWMAGAIYLVYYLSQRDKTRNGAPIMNTSAAAGAAPAEPPSRPRRRPAHRPRRQARHMRPAPTRALTPVPPTATARTTAALPAHAVTAPTRIQAPPHPAISGPRGRILLMAPTSHTAAATAVRPLPRQRLRTWARAPRLSP